MKDPVDLTSASSNVMLTYLTAVGLPSWVSSSITHLAAIILTNLGPETMEALHASHSGVTTLLGRESLALLWPPHKQDLITLHSTCQDCIFLAPSNLAPAPEQPVQPDFPFFTDCMDRLFKDFERSRWCINDPLLFDDSIEQLFFGTWPQEYQTPPHTSTKLPAAINLQLAIAGVSWRVEEFARSMEDLTCARSGIDTSVQH